MKPVRSAFAVLLILVLGLAAAAPAGAKSALPNLAVTKVSKPPKTKTVGSKIKLIVKVANKGGSQAPATKLGLYLGKGKKHKKKDRRLKRVKVKSLAAGKGQKLKLKALLPKKTKPGTYRLFACVDDTRRVKESRENDNCRGSKKLRLLGNAKTLAPLLAPLPPAAAFSMSDGLDWGFIEDAEQRDPKAGDPVTVNLTAANGIPGQAGYTRTGVASEPFRSGNATTLDYSGSTSSEDDGQVTVPLPFAFPFGGIEEQSISVSTNGWVSFRSPAWDYWNDAQPYDYRGGPFVVGEFERGMMPYWADLDLREQGAGTGSVTEVVAPGNAWVAFQWDVGQHSGGAPRRTFQVVLFPDGSFRFDYPGENAGGGNEAFVGYSLGTGPKSADIIAESTQAVPTSSLLFTPNALPAAGPTEAGTVTTSLPKGSSFVSADAGCTLTSAPTASSYGLVSCDVPSLAVGQQVARNVVYATPPNAPGESRPANYRYLGTYTAGPVKLTDGDEVNHLSPVMEAMTPIEIVPQFSGGPPQAGVPMTFEPIIHSLKHGLDEPSATFSVTNATISSVTIAGQAIPCTSGPAGSIDCELPSGIVNREVDVVVVPITTGTVELTTTAEALNAPSVTRTFGVS
ncbi:MAG TPA: CARDB domain-containing protein [Solirubrobacterales bacterium]|nr:CARDB domain-containing protein [Solirubrobacterales bacterium]